MSHLLRKKYACDGSSYQSKITESNGPFDCPRGTTNHLVPCV